MFDTNTELSLFHQFATERLKVLEHRVSLDELFDEWRTLNPNELELQQSVKAIAASLRDLDSGAPTTDARTVVAQLKSRFGFKE